MTYWGNNSLTTLKRFVIKHNPNSIEMPTSTYKWLFLELKKFTQNPGDEEMLSKLPLPPQMEFEGILVTPKD